MYLLSNCSKPKIAKENIFTYKAIYVQDKNHWRPFEELGNTIYEYGCVEDTRRERICEKLNYRGEFEDCYQISMGYIYSYSKPDFDDFHKNKLFDNARKNVVFVNCFILKGSKYFIGINGNYTSKLLVVGRPVKKITRKRILKLKWVKLKRKIYG